MRGNTIRRILVALVIIILVFSYADCKRQPKCGCGRDVLRTYTNVNASVVFNDTYSLLYFQTEGDPYSFYYFCNPAEMIPKLAESKSGDILQVSGHVYWDCNYVSQSSSSSYYQGYQQIFQVEVTDISLNLYGKK